MASAAHQSLLLWSTRQMIRDGFLLSGLDGHVPQAGDANALAAPFQLGGVRPDAWAIHFNDGLVAFAEAKTRGDIDNRHTRDQLRVLGTTRMRDGKAPCLLYIAIPRGAVYALDRVLADVGLLTALHVRRLHVPEVLLGR